ncbi:MAG: hypothetical protein CM15mP81_09530 [Alphaproteobacteria bacterium]|nr:MAG: hypothetical protein CM15mP81_09530 [Alphaproteobacteria bacterium]
MRLQCPQQGTSTTNVKVGDIDYTLTINPNNGGKVTVELKDGNNIIPTNILNDATVNWMSNIIIQIQQVLFQLLVQLLLQTVSMTLM